MNLLPFQQKFLSYLMNCLWIVQTVQHHAFQEHHLILHCDRAYSLPFVTVLFVALATLVILTIGNNATLMVYQINVH